MLNKFVSVIGNNARPDARNVFVSLPFPSPDDEAEEVSDDEDAIIVLIIFFPGDDDDDNEEEEDGVSHCSHAALMWKMQRKEAIEGEKRRSSHAHGCRGSDALSDDDEGREQQPGSHRRVSVRKAFRLYIELIGNAVHDQNGEKWALQFQSPNRLANIQVKIIKARTAYMAIIEL